MQNINSKLLVYQKPHCENLCQALLNYDRALDASDTGTGKTYTAIASAKILNLRPFIICPKSVISTWVECMKYFDCKYYGISNYELIQNCRYYSHKMPNEKSNCTFINKINLPKTKKGPSVFYKWKLPEDAILIFDEAHRCKNKRTNNSALLFGASQTNTKILMLSATVCDKPKTFHLCGYVLGLYSNLRYANNWIEREGNEYSNVMIGVHKHIFENGYGSRMRIKDLGDLFPQNQVIAKCFDMDCAKEIQEQYDVIAQAVEELRKKEENSVGLGVIVRARMRIEMLKIPTFVEMAKEFLSEGLSVAIFVNFTNTLETLGEQLKTNCFIYGEQTMDERMANIKAFNTNASKIIICNIKSGGVGISLHDTNGNHPRITIISPSWSAVDIIQAVGRCFRAKGKSAVRQRIVFCKKTIEEDICENMRDKIVNIANLNDGHVSDGYKIEGLVDGNECDLHENMSDFDKTFQKINSLELKKKRLEQELKNVENEIASLTTSLNLLVVNFD